MTTSDGAGYEPHIEPSDAVSAQESDGEVVSDDAGDAVPTPVGPASEPDGNTVDTADEPPAEPWQDAQDEEN